MPELPFNQLLTRCRRRPRSAAGTARFFVCKTCKEIKMYPNQEEKKKSTLFIICSSQLQCNRPVSFRFARQMWHRDPAWAKTRTNHRECNSIIIFFSQKEQSCTYASTLIRSRDARFRNDVPPSELLQIFIVIAFLLTSRLP